MEHVSTISQQSLSKPTATHQRNFNEEERKAVSYFYGHLKAIYLGEYDRNFRDERMIKASKREWAEDIIGFSREQIDNGIAWIKAQKINHEDGWQYLDVGRCIGAIREANRTRTLHKLYERPALPDKAAQDRAEQAGKSTLEDMKSWNW